MTQRVKVTMFIKPREVIYGIIYQIGRKSFHNSIKLFAVVFELRGVIYLYMDFVTDLPKIVGVITLTDKIKIKQT